MSNTRNGHTHNKRKTFQGQPVTVKSAAEPPDRGRGIEEIGLHTIQHRSYQHTIQIYHFRSNFISVNRFRKILSEHAAFGYKDTMIGPDTQMNLYRPDGDELPANTIEVAYLPDIFTRTEPGTSKGRGFALGFRTHDYKAKKLQLKNKYDVPSKKPPETIEWFCFDHAIEHTILRSWVFDLDTRIILNKRNVDSNDPNLLFDHVADLWKGTVYRTVRDAHQEHADWHASLMQAHLRSLKLTLAWKGHANQYIKACQARREAEMQAALEERQGLHNSRLVEMNKNENDIERMADVQGCGDVAGGNDAMDLS